jgi:hypothetical protein
LSIQQTADKTGKSQVKDTGDKAAFSVMIAFNGQAGGVNAGSDDRYANPGK